MHFCCTVDQEGRFSYPWGTQIEPVPRLPRGDPDHLVASNSDLEIDARTHHFGGGESFDLDYAVHALVTIERRAAARSPSDGPSVSRASDW